ncbi:MAG: exodeoxyribonuclease VII large subunit [Clostridia bacterium]|nr:exodeoxyribonuclease VII large subunit [Clostridia bacterium]
MQANVFSITQINEYIKMTLETNAVLKSVFLRGEISNLKSNYASGHMYFSLKDEGSSIRAVMFRGNASRLKFRAESGMRVVVHGKISAYTVSGDYQIIIDDMQPDGAGALALAFEQIKQRLAAEGLFDASRKKPIPTYARSVGVITSASGAALHDILNVSGRRDPSAQVIIYPSYVQGELAPRSLMGGIKFFNERHKVDVIIIGRGGGSAEDLWCFNDEQLARVIADSEIPVISAVGHETDFTICDFVADMRAPTPSAAAELAFFDAAEVMFRAEALGRRAEQALLGKIEGMNSRLNLLERDIKLHSPENVLNEKQIKLERCKERINTLIKERVQREDNGFRVLCTRLEGVNPLAVLSRGYSVVEREGEIISSVNDVNVGDNVTVRMSNGAVKAQITEKKAMP